jgi:hypothetical protein
MSACIYYNHCLIFFSILNACSLIAIHHITHSSFERSTGFAPMSHQIGMPCSEEAAASTRTVFYLQKCKEKLTGINYSEMNIVAWHI